MSQVTQGLSQPQNIRGNSIDVVVLAASAGSPASIGVVLRGLPSDFPVPIVVLLHGELKSSVKEIRQQLPFDPHRVKRGAVLAPGRLLLCPPGMFVELQPDGTFLISPTDHNAIDSPVEHFFESVARNFGKRAIGVILAGLGADGVRSARYLRLAGGCVILQREETNDLIRPDTGVTRASLSQIASALVDLVGDRHVPASAHSDIPESMLLEERIDQSEAKFRALVEPFAQAVWETDAAGMIVTDTPSWRAYTGQTLEEALGDGWVNAVHPDDRAYALHQWRKAVRNGAPLNAEFRLQGPGGDWRWTNVRAVALRDAGGKILKWVGMNIDITERKQTEEILRQSEEKLHWASDLNAFRVKLNDALGPLNDPLQILREAMRVIGEQLQVDRVMYAEVDEERDSYVIPENYVRGEIPKILGHFSLSAFGGVSEILRRGQLLVINDVRSAPGLKKADRTNLLSTGVVATLGVPLIKDGRWVANFGIQHTTAREWTISETALVQETAERTWATLERARAEDALRQSEARYRILHENLRDAFVQVDMQGNILNCNDIYCQMMGYSYEELTTLTYQDLTPERWHAMEERIVREQILPRGFSDIYEKEYRRKDGSVFPVELRTILWRDSSGQPKAMWAIIRDITDRKRAEEDLRKSEARIQKALSIETVGVLFFRLDGAITDANDAFLKMSGYSREELVQLEEWSLLTPPEFMKVTSRAAKEVAEKGQATPYEKQMLRKDGSRWWGLFAPTRLTGRGLESECVEFIIDITERKRFEERFRLLVTASSDLVYRMNADWSQMESLVGKGMLASLDTPVSDWMNRYILPEDQAQVWAFVQDAIRTMSVFEAEHRVILADGSVGWIYSRAVPVQNEQGEIMEWFGAASDVTLRKQAEAALRENERQLQLLNESLEQKVEEKTSELRQLASELTKAEQRERNRISHILHDDLQQRIYAIQMQLSFLRQELPGGNRAALREVSNIDKELDDVLKIARNLSIDLNPPILRGEGLTQAISWLASKMHQQYGLPIEVRADESYTISDVELHVLLFNCVRELLFNVVKHAQAVRAEVVLQWVNSSIRIEVNDDGHGF
ncbi:MAG: PAS domain S-box protein, partial [Syntrophothermus sp.]